MNAALDLFAKFSDDSLIYVDCLNMVLCKHHGITEIVTGDDDYDKVTPVFGGFRATGCPRDGDRSMAAPTDCFSRSSCSWSFPSTGQATPPLGRWGAPRVPTLRRSDAPTRRFALEVIR